MESSKKIFDLSPVTSGKENNNFISLDETINSCGEATAIGSELKSEGATVKPTYSGERLERVNDQNERNENFSEAEMHQIERAYEPFLHYNEKGNLQRVSELSLAVLYQNHREIVFNPREKLFYKYDSQTGLWDTKEDVELEKDVTDFSNNFFSSMGMLTAFQKLGHPTMRKVMEVLKTRVCDDKFFEKTEVEAEHWIHLANGVVEFNPANLQWELKPFSPRYRSRSRIEVNYDPDADAPRFRDELIRSAMNDEDWELLQDYMGQSIMGPNTSQTVLLLTGTPGGGKSCIVDILRKLVGPRYCAELRLQHGYGRFEVSHYVNKRLLVGSDVPSDFLNRKSAGRLKAFTGGDPLNFEFKCSKQFGEITGDFNIVITSNSSPQVRLDNDGGAFARRIRWIRLVNPPSKNPIQNFAELLFKTEGPGIVNLALGGATRVIGNGGKIPPTPTQKERVKQLLEETDPTKIFARDYIFACEGADITMKELWNDFNSIREARDFMPIERRAFNKILPDVIEACFHCIPRNDIQRAGGHQRGFRGITFRPMLTANR